MSKITKSTRRVHDSAFKTKVVLEALKNTKTLAQLSSDFGIHAQQITTGWRTSGNGRYSMEYR